MENTFKKSVLASLNISHESQTYKDLVIGKEYFAFDVPKFFFGSAITTIWRKIFSDGVVKRDYLNILAVMFFGPATVVTDGISKVQNMIKGVLGLSAGGSLLTLGGTIEYLTNLWTTIQNTHDTEGTDTDNVKKTKTPFGIYYKYISNIKKVDFYSAYDLDVAKKVIPGYIKISDDLMKYYCPTITPRSLTANELETFKLFRPNSIRSEVNNAKDIINKITVNKEEWVKLYTDLINQTEKVLEFIMDSIETDVIKK